MVGILATGMKRLMPQRRELKAQLAAAVARHDAGACAYALSRERGESVETLEGIMDALHANMVGWGGGGWGWGGGLPRSRG